MNDDNELIKVLIMQLEEKTKEVSLLHAQIKWLSDSRSLSEELAMRDAALARLVKEIDEKSESEQKRLADKYKRQIDDMLNSTSWRVTLPIRALKNMFRSL